MGISPLTSRFRVVVFMRGLSSIKNLSSRLEHTNPNPMETAELGVSVEFFKALPTTDMSVLHLLRGVSGLSPHSADVSAPLHLTVQNTHILILNGASLCFEVGSICRY